MFTKKYLAFVQYIQHFLAKIIIIEIYFTLVETAVVQTDVFY